MGVGLATLGGFAPTQKRALTKIAPRALIGGSMVSLMTASIAGLDIKIILDVFIFLSLGLLYDVPNIEMRTSNWNSTLV